MKFFLTVSLQQKQNNKVQILSAGAILIYICYKKLFIFLTVPLQQEQNNKVQVLSACAVVVGCSSYRVLAWRRHCGTVSCFDFFLKS